MFLISPSPCENFAYTLVEAMSCGSPITCANSTAMPETCGNAAIYFDPENIHEMAKVMEKIILDDELKKKLATLSIKRVDELPNYEQVFNETINIIKKL
jgi:glycosyltransferase involved in cell wall biosynthesis